MHGAPRFCFVTSCISPWGVPKLQSESHRVGPERRQRANQTAECRQNSERWGETGFVTGKENLGSRHKLRSNIRSVSFPSIFWSLRRLLCWEQGAHFSWICVPSSRSDVGQRKGSKNIQTSTNTGDSVNSKTPRLGRGASPRAPRSAFVSSAVRPSECWFGGHAWEGAERSCPPCFNPCVGSRLVCGCYWGNEVSLSPLNAGAAVLTVLRKRIF